jgi:hypothetical protein
MALLGMKTPLLTTSLLLLICSGLFTPLRGQQVLLLPGEDNLFGGDPTCNFCTPGVHNRSQSKGVELRQEIQAGFRLASERDAADAPERRVAFLEQTTFKFKIPLINSLKIKMLLGYEWDTEKFRFEPEGLVGGHPVWRHLDERRLKTNKLSFYLTRSWNDRYYTSVRLRLSLNGDYQGLMDFDSPYRTYSAIFALGKKVTDYMEWAAGFTVSSNQVRTIPVPFFAFNRTWNERWGIETVLPGQAFVRRNIGRNNAIMLGAEFHSKFYTLNWTDDGPRPNPGFEPTFLRYNGFRTVLHYEHRLSKWFWAYAQGGLYLPWQTRFNPIADVEAEIDLDAGTRPLLRVGLFLAPPRELIR